jgi:hypothetical protein
MMINTVREQISGSEHKLVEHFGFSYLLDTNLDIISVYRILVDHAFLTNEQGAYADALRIAWSAISDITTKRKTLTFDNLIENELSKNNNKENEQKFLIQEIRDPQLVFVGIFNDIQTFIDEYTSMLAGPDFSDFVQDVNFEVDYYRNVIYLRNGDELHSTYLYRLYKTNKLLSDQ